MSLGRRERTIQALERAEAHADARDLRGWAGLFHLAATELRRANNTLAALGVQDKESPSEIWTSFTTKGDEDGTS